LPWTFFASSAYYSLTSLTGNYTLITKIYFPREILPLAGVALAFADYIIASVIFFIMLAAYGIGLTLNALWIFPLLLLLFVFTVSVCLVLSSLNVYYRDVKLATGFLIQLLFFASPIIYSIDKLSTKLKLVLFLNPLTFIIENMRRCLIEGRGVVLWQFVLVGVIVAAFYYLAYRFFIKT
ncbi:MAG: ABC transporter permease, partial [Candidatus Dadabacteria bacterium]|nr:ABC transporter permease [Candidatus Dadabacteria bacterium]